MYIMSVLLIFNCNNCNDFNNNDNVHALGPSKKTIFGPVLSIWHIANGNFLIYDFWPPSPPINFVLGIHM